MNTVFRIAFGDYELALDRKALTYSLAETVTGTVWATELPVGWVEVQERESGAIQRVEFGACKLVSVAEKMGASGKRLLLGLDAPGGIPIDLYFICGPKEIQLTVEASRDSKTHTLDQIGLLPGLCHADQGGYLVLPIGEGQRLNPINVRSGERFPVWSPWEGLTMPFVGAVQTKSALALLTDSAYATAELTELPAGGAAADWIFLRDPERRRLDVRLILIPNGDHIAVARAYRDKLIGERAHITLRKKVREVSGKESLLGAAFIKMDVHGDLTRIPEYLSLLRHQLGLEQAIVQFVFNRYHEVPEDQVRQAFAEVKRAGYFAVIRPVDAQDERITVRESQARFGGDTTMEFIKNTSVPRTKSWWEFMEETLGAFSENSGHVILQGELGGLDWLATASDFTLLVYGGVNNKKESQSVPLLSTVYHDSLVAFSGVAHFDRAFFLKALLRLNPPYLSLPMGIIDREEGAEWVDALHPQAAILCNLHSLTFPAFLTAHTFLTPDFLVEEAFYSDKTYVLINQSETEAYDAGEFLLPPGGFYVKHPQFEAHDALRVGAQAFPERALRLARSLENRPLSESQQIQRQEFRLK